jgi:hypothetical protein
MNTDLRRQGGATPRNLPAPHKRIVASLWIGSSGSEGTWDPQITQIPTRRGVALRDKGKQMTREDVFTSQGAAKPLTEICVNLR